jgi:hypothetical protein
MCLKRGNEVIKIWVDQASYISLTKACKMPVKVLIHYNYRYYDFSIMIKSANPPKSKHLLSLIK